MSLWLAPEGQAINLWQAHAGLAGKAAERYAPGFHHFACNADSRARVDACYDLLRREGVELLAPPAALAYLPGYDRKSVVEGPSVSVRVALGGARFLEKKKASI